MITFSVLLETVNEISAASPAMDSEETQFVQSFYDTTYRAQMIRCLIQALKLHENMSGLRMGDDIEDVGNSNDLFFLDNCVYVFSELVLTSSKFMKQVFWLTCTVSNSCLDLTLIFA